MRSANQRFLVTGFDHDAWRIVVEAPSCEEAIRKAQAFYMTDGLGNGNAFELRSSYADWSVEPMVLEALT